MKNRSFTLVEIIVVVVIVGILATLGLPYFQNVMESSKEKVCDTNLKTLLKAVEIYTMEHDTVPGSLSELDDKYIQKAYASVMSGKNAWKIRLAYFLVEGPQWGIAYAQGFGMPNLRCPNNPDTSSTQISYGLSTALAQRDARGYKNAPDSYVVIADSVNAIFNYGAAATGGQGSTTCKFDGVSNARFHKKFHVGQTELFFKGVTKNGQKGKLISGDESIKWEPEK